MFTKPRIEQKIILGILWTFTAITIFILLFIILYILKKGLPVINYNFLMTNPIDMGKSGGIFSTIIGTITLTLGAILIATPLGVGTAIYLTEYTRENKFTRIVKFGSECLAGIPSIIFGLFGFILFVIKLQLGWSILSGSLTLAFMILPTIIRTSEEAISQFLIFTGSKLFWVYQVADVTKVFAVSYTGIMTRYRFKHWPQYR
jgi:phosphate transport system permease protein